MTERDEPYTLDVDEAADAYADLMAVRLGAPRTESIATFRRMIEAVRQEEREKAAQIADRSGGTESEYIAARIREQGKEQGA